MPKGRPSISAEVVREIMLEAGHRCAVDGTRFPLEKAHIVAWNESRDHTAENLIVLCANCHEMFDLGKIDKATMREYKKRPWVSRYNNGQPAPVEAKATKKAQIVIDIKLEDFNELQSRLLQHALAAFLNISPSDVKVGPPEESNSIRVTVELPADAMNKLLDAFQRANPELFVYLAPFGLLDLIVDQFQAGTSRRTGEIAKIPYAKRIYVGNLSPQTTEDQLVDLFLEIGPVGFVTIMTEGDTGRSSSFAFVEMDEFDALQAIERFDGYELNGRRITVSEGPPSSPSFETSGGFGGGSAGGHGGPGGFGRRYE